MAHQMNTVQIIARNTLILILANFLSLFLGLFINIYIARYFLPEKFGIISAAINLATLFAIFTDLGVSRYLTIEVSRQLKDAKDYVNSALFIKLVLIMLIYGAILVTAYVSHFEGEKLLVVAIIGIYMMLVSTTQIFQAYFQSVHSMEHIAISYLINPAILLIGIGYIMFTGKDIVSLALVYMLSGLVVLGYTVAMFVLFMRYLPRPTLKLAWPLLIGGLPLSVANLFYFLYYKIDIQIIDYLKGSAAVGYYSVAYKLIEAVICIPAMFTMAIFPLISNYFFHKDARLSLLLNQSIKYLYLVGLPIAIGVFIIADKVIFLLYQDKYIDSIEVLRVLSAGLVLVFINSVQCDFLIGTNMQKATVYINIIAAFANVALNFMVIPSFGIVGSAYTVVVTQLIILLLNVHMIRKSGHVYEDFGSLLKITFCGIVMGTFVYIVHDQNLLLIVAAAAAIYFALILLTRSLSQDDLELISRVFPWIKRISIFA